jgi:hypothetical protein
LIVIVSALVHPGDSDQKRNMSAVNIPMPPLELRRLVGPTDPEDFDNPRGEPIYERYGLSPDV